MPAEINGVPPSRSKCILLSLQVQRIPFITARNLVVSHHYLHSIPGGTMLTFGVFLETRLMGAIVFGAGPQNGFRLVDGARMEDCLTLTRLWLTDVLPRNSESRVLGFTIKAMQKYTSVKFLVSYCDPVQGHIGTIYLATNWLYTGLSTPMSLFDLGDGVARHSRSFAHAFGTRSISYFKSHEMQVHQLNQTGKYRYVYFLDKSWATRLRPLVLPYPRKEPQ